MRPGKIVKGVCLECLKIRAFQLTHVERPSTKLYSFDSLRPVVVQAYPLYYGNCSGGHYSLFNLIPSGLSPERAPRRTPDPARFGRDWSGLIRYKLWYRDSFRRPHKEEHYKKDHVCTERCPLYDWGPWEGLN